MRKLLGKEISYSRFCIVSVLFVATLVFLLAGCHKEAKPPRTFQDYRALDLQNFDTYHQAFDVAQTSDQRKWALEGMADIEVSLEQHTQLCDLLKRYTDYGREETVNYILLCVVRNSGANFNTKLEAYRELPMADRDKALPTMMETVQRLGMLNDNNFSGALELLSYASARTDTVQVNALLKAVTSSVDRNRQQTVLERLPFATSVWRAVFHQMFFAPTVDPGGLLAYYNHLGSREQRQLRQIMLERPGDIDWVTVYEKTPARSLRELAQRRLTLDRSVDDIVNDANSAQSDSTTLLLAAQLENKDLSSSDWLRVWKTADGYLKLLAEEHIRAGIREKYHLIQMDPVGLFDSQ